MTSLYKIRFSLFAPFCLVLILAFGVIAESNAQTLSPSRAAIDSARFSVSPLSLSYGSVAVNATSAKTLTVTNSGTVALVISSVTTTKTEVTVSPTTATIAAGGNQVFTATFAPTSAGNKSGSITFTHNADNVANNTTVIPFTAFAPSTSSSSTIPTGTSVSITLGSTGITLNFIYTGTGGQLIVNQFNSAAPPGSFNNPDNTGKAFTLTGQFWEFLEPAGFSNATVNITFPNGSGGTARLARRPAGSGAGVTWDLIPLSKTTYSGGTITATGQGGFSQWTVVTPGFVAPTLTALSVTQGSKGGNYNVILTGTNFITDSLSISFGAGITVNTTTLTSATEVVVNITVSSTATGGASDVVLKTAGGTVTKTGAFSVLNAAPTVASISPTNGAKGATLSVAITGAGFETGVTSVSFGTGITVNSLTVTSATQATASIAISGTATTGARDVVVTNAAPGGGSVTLTGGFTVGNLAPTVASVAPTSGVRGGTLNFTLTGSSFESGVTTAVSFGAGITVNSFTVASATQITGSITIAATATLGVRDISVTNTTPGGGTATLTGQFTITAPTGVEGSDLIIPKEFVLEEVFPNPFNPSTTVRFGLPERSSVKIEVYSVLGKLITTLIEQEMQHGYHQIDWKAENAASGTYLIRMSAESLESGKKLTTSRKAVLLK